MSVLHSLPSAAAASSVKVSAVPTEPAAGELSFAVVLSAQLGLSSAPDPELLLAGSEEHPSEDKAPVPHTVRDLAVQDPAANLPMLPLALPIISAQGQIVTAPAPDSEPEEAAQSSVSAAGRRTFLPGAAVAAQAASDPAEMPAPPAAPAESQAPANFAAVLQSLPGASQEATHRDHAVSAADVQPSSATAAMLTAAPEPRAESVQRLPQLTTAVPVAMQDPRWGEAFSERVVWITGQQVQTAEIRVEPPQLGPIEVRVSITNDQANLLFTAPHAAARDAIQMSLPRLQEMLVDSGLSLGNVFVGAHNPGQQQPGYRQNDGSSVIRAVTPLDTTGAQSPMGLRRELGLVDLYA